MTPEPAIKSSGVAAAVSSLPRSAPRGHPKSQRAQEIEDVLLVGRRQQVEVANYRVGFRTGARMSRDGGEEVVGAAVMQEEDTLAEPPQRRRSELAAAGI